MNEHDLNRLREAAWRGEISPEELHRRTQAEACAPEVIAALKLDSELGQALRQLPDVPVASNFTARVIQVVEQAERARARTSVQRGSWWRLWVPRLAGAGAIALVVGMGVYKYDQKQARTNMAKDLQMVATMTVPQLGTDAEVWQNFDVILRMGNVTADDELLSVAKTQ